MIFFPMANGIGSIRKIFPLIFGLVGLNSWGGETFYSYARKNKSRLAREIASEVGIQAEDANRLLLPSFKDTSNLNLFFWNLRLRISEEKRVKPYTKVQSKVLTELYLKCSELCSDSELINGIIEDFRQNISKRYLESFKSTYFSLIEKRPKLAWALKDDVFFLTLNEAEKAKALPQFNDPVQRAFLGDTSLQIALAEAISAHVMEMKKTKGTDEGKLLQLPNPVNLTARSGSF